MAEAVKTNVMRIVEKASMAHSVHYYDPEKGIEGDGCVTVRERDTMEQVRIPIAELKDYLREKLAY